MLTENGFRRELSRAVFYLVICRVIDIPQTDSDKGPKNDPDRS